MYEAIIGHLSVRRNKVAFQFSLVGSNSYRMGFFSFLSWIPYLILTVDE